MLTFSKDILCSGGHGGAGFVSFGKQIYEPRGGPDGGNGGNGGSVIFQAAVDVDSCQHLSDMDIIHGKKGKGGSSLKKSGLAADDLIIKVPLKTSLIFRDQDKRIHLNENGEQCIVSHGGKGGKGNYNFSTSRNQVPQFAQDGLPGEETNLTVSYSFSTDVAIIGPANTGKSTLLRLLTGANVEIKPYPFTTRRIVSGILKTYSHNIRISEIPASLLFDSQAEMLSDITQLNFGYVIVMLEDQQNPEDLDQSIRHIHELIKDIPHSFIVRLSLNTPSNKLDELTLPKECSIVCTKELDASISQTLILELSQQSYG